MIISNPLRYAQITGELEKQIRSGALAPGAPLPTVPELRACYGVSHITILRVYRELAEKKLTEKSGRRYLICAPVEFPGAAMTIVSGFRSFAPINSYDNYGNRILCGMIAGCAAGNFHFHIPPHTALLNRCQNPPDDDLRQTLREVKKFGADTGVVIDMRFSDEQIERLLLPSLSPRNIAVAGRKSELPIFSTGCDRSLAGQDAARLLLRPGNEKNYWIFPLYSEHFDDTAIIQNFRDTLTKNGVPAHCIRSFPDANKTEQGNARLFDECLAFLKRFSGKLSFLVFNEDFARILCAALMKEQFVPGRDFRLLTCGGREYCFNQHPFLSSIAYNPEGIGRKAVELLMRRESEKPGFFPVPHHVELNETI